MPPWNPLRLFKRNSITHVHESEEPDHVRRDSESDRITATYAPSAPSIRVPKRSRLGRLFSAKRKNKNGFVPRRLSPVPDDPEEGQSGHNSPHGTVDDAPGNTAIGRAQAHSGNFDGIDLGRHNVPLRVTNPSPASIYAPSQYEPSTRPVTHDPSIPLHTAHPVGWQAQTVRPPGNGDVRYMPLYHNESLIFQGPKRNGSGERPQFLLDDGLHIEVGNDQDGWMTYEEFQFLQERRPRPIQYVIAHGANVTLQHADGRVIYRSPERGSRYSDRASMLTADGPTPVIFHDEQGREVARLGIDGLRAVEGAPRVIYIDRKGFQHAFSDKVYGGSRPDARSSNPRRNAQAHAIESLPEPLEPAQRAGSGPSMTHEDFAMPLGMHDGLEMGSMNGRSPTILSHRPPSMTGQRALLHPSRVIVNRDQHSVVQGSPTRIQALQQEVLHPRSSSTQSSRRS